MIAVPILAAHPAAEQLCRHLCLLPVHAILLHLGLPPPKYFIVDPEQGVAWLQGAPGGVLRNRHDTYKAAEDMMASLGDQYSQFLPPSQVLLPAF